jgi:N-acyl-D-aspartate/D-glutamate deacylase
MTAASAARLGLADRGRIQVGFQGDAVLFDPATFSDTATFEAPCQYPVGLAAVTVAGKLVVHGDRMTGERPGRFCRPASR